MPPTLHWHGWVSWWTFFNDSVEIKFNFSLFPCRGTVDKFEETYHHITFDDGMQRWFKLDFDSRLIGARHSKCLEVMRMARSAKMGHAERPGLYSVIRNL